MPFARIDSWQFQMPEGWMQTENEVWPAYFEEPGGERALYVKALKLPEPRSTSSHFAEYIQDVQFRAVVQPQDSAWEVRDRRSTKDGDLTRSALDLYDQSSNYRVLSLVVCSAQQAIQVTIHDYWCEDYAVSRFAFADLEGSIAMVPGAA